MLEISDLSFAYRKGENILNDVSFSLNEGELMAILGNNGVGKSTLLKCCSRILRASSGRVLLNGQNIMNSSYRSIAKSVAFVAQKIPNTQMTVHDVVMLGRRPYMKWGFTSEDHDIVHASMEKLGVLDLRGRFLSNLSGGEQQKVILARALAQQPKLLLLDEPTSSLDLKNQYQVLRVVKNLCKEINIMVIVVIHDINLALRFCDKFLMLRNGYVYKYGNNDIVNTTSLNDVYDVNAEVVRVKNHDMVIIDE